MRSPTAVPVMASAARVAHWRDAGPGGRHLPRTITNKSVACAIAMKESTNNCKANQCVAVAQIVPGKCDRVPSWPGSRSRSISRDRRDRGEEGDTLHGFMTEEEKGPGLSVFSSSILRQSAAWYLTQEAVGQREIATRPRRIFSSSTAASLTAVPLSSRMRSFVSPLRHASPASVIRVRRRER
jgi:hypothetical protein